MKRLILAFPLALAACGSQTPPVLRADDNTGSGIAVSTAHPVEVHEAVGRALDTVR